MLIKLFLQLSVLYIIYVRCAGVTSINSSSEAVHNSTNSIIERENSNFSNVSSLPVEVSPSPITPIYNLTTNLFTADGARSFDASQQNSTTVSAAEYKVDWFNVEDESNSTTLPTIEYKTESANISIKLNGSNKTKKDKSNSIMSSSTMEYKTDSINLTKKLNNSMEKDKANLTVVVPTTKYATSLLNISIEKGDTNSTTVMYNYELDLADTNNEFNNSTEEDDMIDQNDYNCKKETDYYITEALDLMRLRNKIKDDFLELGDDPYLGPDKRERIKKLYNELVKLEVVIGKHVNCAVSKQTWTIRYFFVNLMRLTCRRRLNIIRKRMIKERENYFYAALEEPKNDENQVEKFNSIAELQDRMSILENLLCLEYIK